ALRADRDPLEALVADGGSILDDPTARPGTIAALRDEIRGVLLGYDVDPDRAERVAALLESTAVPALSPPARDDLATLKAEIVASADLEQLFRPAPPAVGGVVVPSNAARLRAYVRRMRAGGAGIAGDFMASLRAALGHYGITSLDHGDALERAV